MPTNIRSRGLVLLVTVLLLVAGAAGASEIYKWVDADGNVHYSDLPEGREAERLAIVSRPTDPARVQAAAEARAEALAKAHEARQESTAEESTPEEQQAAAAERRQKCESYRARLQKMLTSRRLYREGDNGERVYLDDAQMEEARARVQSQVEDYCGA